MKSLYAGWCRALLAAGMLVGGCLVVHAADPAAKAAAPDAAAALQAYLESAKPGKHHEELAKMVGEWEAQVEHFMPGMPVEKSTATAKRSMIMGGRYLQEEFKGTMAGMPFEGIMTLGYDNNLKKYTSVWIDSMGTGTMVGHGTPSKGGMLVECKGTMYCPMHQKEMACRTVTKMTDADHEIFEMYGPGPDGKETLAMRIHYTRKK
ncbi:MAG: DUF1579 domain-containing protein [Pirellulales bacterium]|nr:DUF1579 domain-containing protein [Pirellulales bacterium]